jgi:hypothetical protein
MITATAWAVTEKGSILVNTCDGTRRGSIIKFVLECVEVNIEADLFMLARFDDTQIEELWAKYKEPNSLCTIVHLTTGQPAESNKVQRRRPRGD